jgi:hypothetical protein
MLRPCWQRESGRGFPFGISSRPAQTTGPTHRGYFDGDPVPRFPLRPSTYVRRPVPLGAPAIHLGWPQSGSDVSRTLIAATHECDSKTALEGKPTESVFVTSPSWKGHPLGSAVAFLCSLPRLLLRLSFRFDCGPPFLLSQSNPLPCRITHFSATRLWLFFGAGFSSACMPTVSATGQECADLFNLLIEFIALDLQPSDSRFKDHWVQ